MEAWIREHLGDDFEFLSRRMECNMPVALSFQRICFFLMTRDPKDGGLLTTIRHVV